MLFLISLVSLTWLLQSLKARNQLCLFEVLCFASWFDLVVCINWSIDFFASLQYLKDQRLPPQTFIPLQSVRVKPIMERLRTLGGTAKLVFDVIQYPFPLVAALKNLVVTLFTGASKFCYLILFLSNWELLFLEIYLLQLACPSLRFYCFDCFKR